MILVRLNELPPSSRSLLIYSSVHLPFTCSWFLRAVSGLLKGGNKHISFAVLRERSHKIKVLLPFHLQRMLSVAPKVVLFSFHLHSFLFNIFISKFHKAKQMGYKQGRLDALVRKGLKTVMHLSSRVI